MSYADTENEHHEAISTGIVDLRNTVAQLWGSASNQRGQALACDEDWKARAYYEASYAYADAAQRVGTVAQHFEESESYRAGAMEALGPVPGYDDVVAHNLTLQSEVDGARTYSNSLLDQLAVMDAAMGGNGTATPEEIATWVEGTAKALRRFRGIREQALKIVTDQVEQGQQGLGTLADVVTVLLDGEHPEQLKRIRIALGADVPDPVVPGPLKLEIPDGLLEQFRRVARNEPDDWSVRRFEPSTGEIVTGHDVWLRENPGTPEPTNPAVIPVSQLNDTDVYVGTLPSGSQFVGQYMGSTERGRVKLQRPIKGEAGLGRWGVRLEEVHQDTVKLANPAEVRAFHKMVDDSNAEINGEPPEPWMPEPGQIVTVLHDADQRVPVQFVALNMAFPSKAVVQLPGELQAADGVDHVWESREVDVTDLAPASPGEMNAFFAELEAKGLDGAVR